MRNKVYLIRGWLNIAAKITTAEFERINTEHVVLIVALRRPQFLPADADLDPTSLMTNCKKLMDHWKAIEQEHFLFGEYANIALDHGGADVKAVEGDPLLMPWFFETVKALHKSFGQTVVEVEVSHNRDDGRRVRVGKQWLMLEDAIDLLSSNTHLG